MLLSNGSKDIGEPGLAGWTVFLDNNNNGVLDGGESSTLTDVNGNYSFLNLGPGTYRVRELAPAGWVRTTLNPPDITPSSGSSISGVVAMRVCCRFSAAVCRSLPLTQGNSQLRPVPLKIAL